jgi:hypothetical protein
MKSTLPFDPRHVVLYDASGTPITSGNPLPVTATVTGLVDTELPIAIAAADNMANPTAPQVLAHLMGWDGATWDRLPGNSVDGLLINLGVNNDVTVTGFVTANAGTNLNTSALALEATLQNLKTALEIIDDWDESDRAKVNIIAGQAGVSANTGAADASTQRVALASRTIKSASGSVAGSGNNTLIAAVASNKIKVLAFSLSTSSTTAVTCIFQSGAGGTELWRVLLQAPTSTAVGANLATALPGWLFETAVSTLLNLNLSSAQTIHWAATYFEEA